MIATRSPQNSVGKFLGPYLRLRVQGSLGFGAQGLAVGGVSGFRGFGGLVLRAKTSGLRFRVSGLEFRVKGLGFRFQGGGSLKVLSCQSPS